MVSCSFALTKTQSVFMEWWKVPLPLARHRENCQPYSKLDCGWSIHHCLLILQDESDLWPFFQCFGLGIAEVIRSDWILHFIVGLWGCSDQIVNQCQPVSTRSLRKHHHFCGRSQIHLWPHQTMMLGGIAWLHSCASYPKLKLVFPLFAWSEGFPQISNEPCTICNDWLYLGGILWVRQISYSV